MESVLEILSYVGWVLLAITILVFVHEMGHFLFAKLFKMRVERFSIGFPPKILARKIGETEYVIGATPLGGYVKISGMVDESMDTDFAESEPEPWEFRAKPVWQRIIVITAGVVFNVILAAVIFMGLKMAYGETYPVSTDDGSVYVEDESLAYDIGLRTGDRVLALSGHPFEPGGGLPVESLLEDELTVTVLRDGDTLTFQGPDDIMTQLTRAGGLGLSFQPAVVGEVMDDAPAARAGLRPGDHIVAVNGEATLFWVQMTQAIRASEGKPLTLRWVRPDSATAAIPANAVAMYDEGRRVYEASLTPAQDEATEQYYVGILYAENHRDFGVGEAITGGVAEAWNSTRLIATNLKRIVTGRENLRENLGGPVMVAVATKQAAERGARDFWYVVAMLSITLAIVNILPIPALDGGHLAFLIYEGITRREPSLRVRMVMQQVGMVLLLTLMVFLIFNDILRL